MPVDDLRPAPRDVDLAPRTREEREALAERVGLRKTGTDLSFFDAIAPAPELDKMVPQTEYVDIYVRSGSGGSGKTLAAVATFRAIPGAVLIVRSANNKAAVVQRFRMGAEEAARVFVAEGAFQAKGALEEWRRRTERQAWRQVRVFDLNDGP